MLAMLDEEEILRSYIESERYEAAQEAAKAGEKVGAEKAAIKMLKSGNFSVEDIVQYLSALSLDEVKALKEQIMQGKI